MLKIRKRPDWKNLFCIERMFQARTPYLFPLTPHIGFQDE
jgi:hypothetical protein